MRHDYNLVYENIKIRPLVKSDIDSLRKWRNDPSNTAYLNKIPFITSEQQGKWFQSYLDNTNELCFAIDLLEKNQIIGSASLYNFQKNQAEFGKILIGDAEAHGKKAGYNATCAIVNIAFEQLLIEKLLLHCYESNYAALHVYKQVGFEIIDKQCTTQEIEYTMQIDKRRIPEFLLKKGDI